MRICSQNQINQVDFFATVKTHKFDSVNDITLDQLKLHPIIDQTGTHIFTMHQNCREMPKTTLQEQLFY